MARWQFWRSPQGQPKYARPVLLCIAAAAAILFAWRIDRSGYHAFYASAVRSMITSWWGFLFGSFDPANSITLDKLPGFLWPQAISAYLLGFHPWTLQLPQVVEGVACVLVLYRTVRLWAGVNAGLLAAGLFAVTPVTAGVFRSPAEDAALTLLLLLAALACTRAVQTGRLRTIVLCGVWVGLAFQAKMLEAWVVLPAFSVAYLVCAPGHVRRRIGQLLAAGAVMAVVSLSWIAVATVVPNDSRPYIDGTTNNSAFDMVVGYNFLNRFSAVGLSADSTGSVQTRGRAAKVHEGWGKLVERPIGSQTGWLYPLAIAALAVGIAWCRKTARLAGFLLWGTWLLTFALVFSAGKVGGHMYYMGVIDVAVAALSGAGLVELARAFRAGGRRAFVLPGVVAAQIGWSWYLVKGFPRFMPWLTPALIVLGSAAVAVMLYAAIRVRRDRLITTVAWLTALPAMVLAPMAWDSSIFQAANRTGGSILGAIGPSQARRGNSWPIAYGRSGFGASNGQLSKPQQALLAYLRTHSSGAGYLFAAPDWQQASPYILSAGAAVLPMGGFTGQAGFPGLQRFQAIVKAGQLHYVLLSNGGKPSAVTTWVRDDCARIPQSDYHGSDSTVLYRC